MSKSSLLSSRLSNALPIVIILALCLVPELCFADLQGSLVGIQSKLTTIILPTLSTIGLIVAAISFFTGNPNAKTHVCYAILGCAFGFGASAIVDLIRSTVH